MDKEILFFEPNIKNLVWGREDWTISAHANGDVKVRDGRFAGVKLSQLWVTHPELFGGGNMSPNFPLLVKIITTNEDISIQVHPDDDYAAKNENGSLGKTECWYILECEENTRPVLGHNARDRAELIEMVDNGRFADLVNEVPIQKGDFIQLDAGTIHSIKGGIKLLEIQQSSDITYRLYDYGRTSNGKPRQLHLSQAFDVITYSGENTGSNITPATQRPANQMSELIRCDYYTVWEFPVVGETTFTQSHPFLIVCVIGGEGQINDIKIREGDHFILPYGYGEVKVSGEMQLILAVG